MTRRRTILLSLLAAWLAWWVWGWLVPWPRCRVLKERIALLNAVAVDLDVGGHWIYLDLHYPPDGVVVADPGDDGRHGVPYEPCYWGGTFDVDKVRHQHLFLPVPFYPLPVAAVSLQGLGTVLAEYGMRGRMLARAEGKPWQKPLLDRAIRCYLGGRDTLLSTYVPRVRVEQWINGGWERLTQFNTGVGMWFYLAPQETVRLRVGWTALRAVYRRDRLVLTPVPAAELSGLRLLVRRVRDGYWPYPRIGWPFQEFFRTFRSDTLSYGERFTMSCPIRPHFGMFELEAVVLAPGAPRYYQLLNFEAPSYRIDNYWQPRALTFWPLVPTPSGLQAGERAEKGYPGGFVVPRWAVERIKQLGPRFFQIDWNSPTGQLYGPELRAWDDSVGRYRQEQARRRWRQRGRR